LKDLPDGLVNAVLARQPCAAQRQRAQDAMLLHAPIHGLVAIWHCAVHENSSKHEKSVVELVAHCRERGVRIRARGHAEGGWTETSSADADSTTASDRFLARIQNNESGAETLSMDERDDFDPGSPVPEIIRKLLLVALPAELHASAVDLAARVAKHPDVAPHVDKQWGELSESQGNKVAREVGIVARDVISGAGAITASGEHLH